MKRILTLAMLVAGISVAAGAACAQKAEKRTGDKSGIAISGSLGTTGGAIEAQAGLGNYIQLRGGFNYFEYSHRSTYDEIRYSGDLDFSTAGAFLDVRPFANSFLISGGAYFGKKEFSLKGTPDHNVEIGNQTYTPAQVGTLTGGLKLSDSAPYVGVGWDSTFQNKGPWGFKVLLGAMYTGKPHVTLSSSGGTLSNDPNFQAEVLNERQRIADDADEFKVYPVAQAGVSFRF